MQKSLRLAKKEEDPAVRETRTFYVEIVVFPSMCFLSDTCVLGLKTLIKTFLLTPRKGPEVKWEGVW